MRQNRRITIEEVADIARILFGSARIILTSYLNMRRIVAKFVRGLLTADQRQERVEVCEDLLQRVQEDPHDVKADHR